MTSEPTAPPRELQEAVSAASARVARRLVGRYTPVYAALAVLLLVAAALPSRVPADERPAAAASFQPAPSVGNSVGTGSAPGATPPATVGTPAPISPASPPATSGGDAVAAPAGVAPAAAAPVQPPDSSDPGGFADEDGGGDGGGDFAGADGVACPVEFGEDPQISRGVAGALLGAVSPALSLLGPFGPNAVPALALASPILPIIAPLADAASGYIRLFNPLFLQISEFGTQLWRGPLAPLEGPLLELNAAVIQPFEVELLAALSPLLEAVNATPLTPCLQRLVYNVVALVPLPEAP